MRVIPMASEEELVCEGMRHPFQSKEMEESFSYLWGLELCVVYAALLLYHPSPLINPAGIIH
jgi:hypothetical protein